MDINPALGGNPEWSISSYIAVLRENDEGASLTHAYSNVCCCEQSVMISVDMSVGSSGMVRVWELQMGGVHVTDDQVLNVSHAIGTQQPTDIVPLHHNQTPFRKLLYYILFFYGGNLVDLDGDRIKDKRIIVSDMKLWKTNLIRAYRRVDFANG